MMNKFVFVVCGGQEHINELNVSLKFLLKFSKNDILVLTDIARNEIKIEHKNIINIATPVEFSNHQAAIYLKTGIHKFLPKSHNYCYLDGDVVAINSNVDNIFNHYSSPITFAKDHCVIEDFSPHAMNCNCVEKNLSQEQEFNQKLSELFGKIDLQNPKIKKQTEHLQSIFNYYRKNPLKNILKIFKYLFNRYISPVNSFRLGDFIFNKKTKSWYNKEGKIVLFDYPYYEKKLWGISGIRFNKACNYWESKEGKKYEFLAPKCSHLTDYLKKEYNIIIPDTWQHWNGGVFLFNDDSHDFLEYWHTNTINEFKNSYTKTRDQGTLALSVWKFGLQNHKVLPEEFNWITEYANTRICWDKKNGYTKDEFQSIFHPNFLHIYHEWGNKDWSIWKSVMELQRKIS